MSKWKECKLGDVVQINYGKGLPEHKRSRGSVPVFSSAGITGWHNMPLVNTPGIIIGRKGSIGTVYYSDKPFFCIDTAYYIEANESEYDLRYLFYLLNTLRLKDLNEDSAVPGLNRNTAYDQDILLPSIPEQRAIAGVLSSLDDKIDLLHRQNKTLESLAETIWRKMFVEDADAKWRKAKLKDVVEILNGFAFKSEDYCSSGQMIIRTMNFKNGYIDPVDVVYISSDDALKYSKYQLQRLDFLLVMVGASIGNFCIVTKDVLPLLQNQNMWNFRTLGDISQHYLNFALKDITVNNLGNASGSAREFFQKGQFYDNEIIIPAKGSLGAFQEFAETQFSKIEANISQIRTLSHLRDTLLPKLMNAEIKVNCE